MQLVLGEIRISSPEGYWLRRITEEEGWEKGFWRALDLHENTGKTVLVSLYLEGTLTPKVEINTREGCLCIDWFEK